MSLSFGGGRYGNQIIRNYAAHLLALKHDLFISYKQSENVNKLGITLYCGNKKYDHTQEINPKNYMNYLKQNTIDFNINMCGFFQSHDISQQIFGYINKNNVKKNIISKNKFNKRYKNNNDCFIHIRLGDVEKWNPGFIYYDNVLKSFNCDNIYISSDTPEHNIIKKIKKKYKNVFMINYELHDIILFGSTCKYVILSYGSFSAVIGYFSFYSNVFYKKISINNAWDFNSNEEINLFSKKVNSLGVWNEII